LDPAVLDGVFAVLVGGAGLDVGLGMPGQFGDLEAAALQDVEEIAWQVEVTLVDLVDQ
jgi:hypothetical protein